MWWISFVVVIHFVRITLNCSQQCNIPCVDFFSLSFCLRMFLALNLSNFGVICIMGIYIHMHIYIYTKIPNIFKLNKQLYLNSGIVWATFADVLCSCYFWTCLSYWVPSILCHLITLNFGLFVCLIVNKC